MSLPRTLSIPPQDFQLTLAAGKTTIIVGANGSGKTRLAVWIEQQLGGDAHRIAAHRALTLDPGVPKISQKASEFMLRTGLGQLQPEDSWQNIPAWRTGNRWGGKAATSLLRDFDPLVQALFAEQSNIALETHNAAHDNSLARPKLSKFQRLTAIWERILPTRRLIVTGDDIQAVAVGADETPYSAAELSDGERAVFYMVAQALFAVAGGVLIFDEPELHMHRAVLSRLWDELEAARSDCAFLLITHDLDFAASRSGEKLVLRAYVDPDRWEVEQLPTDTPFDEQLTTLILGSRRPVLFVEGDGGSLDLAVYRACYPNFTILPRGGCEQVIHAVRTMRANAALTRVTCAGIVDADSRSPDDVQRLNEMGILVLPVAEIENVFALPAIATAILQEESHDGTEQAARLAKLSDRLFAEAAKPDVQTDVVLRACRRRIDRVLKQVDLSDVADEMALEASLQARIAEISVMSLAAEIRSSLQSAIAARDLPALLAIYDGKERVLAEAASVLRNNKLDVFVGWLPRIMKDPEKPRLRDAIAVLLPQPHAA
jgi:ABC-type branched-subunit amino acid transport system ATPase component